MQLMKIIVTINIVLLATLSHGTPKQPSNARLTPTVRAVAKAMPGVVNLSTEKVIDDQDELLPDFFQERHY